MYKRALNYRLKPKKSEDMICTICGDRAIGFNYNVISCAACKIFFRRYANYRHSVCILIFFPR
jgi:hypothetical protein